MKYWLLIALFVPLPALAELAGSWTLSIDTPRGMQNPQLIVQRDGDTYSGTYHSLRGPIAIENVRTDGQAFSFEMQITVPIGAIDVVYAGTIDGDSMTGAVENPRGKVPFSGKRNPQ